MKNLIFTIALAISTPFFAQEQKEATEPCTNTRRI